MNRNVINLCNSCVHISYCVLTHNHSTVSSCSDFDKCDPQEETPLLKIIKQKPELVNI